MCNQNSCISCTTISISLLLYVHKLVIICCFGVVYVHNSYLTVIGGTLNYASCTPQLLSDNYFIGS